MDALACASAGAATLGVLALAHYPAAEILAPVVAYSGALHGLAVLALATYVPRAPATTLATAISMYIFAGLGVTVGLHRLWTHRSFRGSLPLRLALALAAGAANQGTVYSWVRNHRLHHAHSERPLDPHDASRGFFHSHIGWILVRRGAAMQTALRAVGMEDVKADPALRLSSRGVNAALCFLLPALVARALGDTLASGFMVCGVLTHVFTLHCTWCVNSFAHLYGSRPYTGAASGPAENAAVSLLTYGEGWHDFHHRFPFDYRCAGALSGRYNPSKWLIDLCLFTGLASRAKIARDGDGRAR